MHDAVHQCTVEAGWRAKSLLRAQRFFSAGEAILLYKAQVLSYIEARTPGIAHAAASTLEPLDRVQRQFLRQLGLTEKEAAIEYRLLPLNARRNIAMLGVVHRCTLGRAPSSIAALFRPGSRPARSTRVTRSHSRPVEDLTGVLRQDYISRSALGYATVYNVLPERVVQAATTKEFQRMLQNLVIDRAKAGCEDWQTTLSQLTPASNHPLRYCC